jgi:multiple sugar transport system permease protein
MAENRWQSLFSNSEKLLVSLLLLVGAVIVLYPLGIVLLISFTSGDFFISDAIDKSLSLANYREAWQRGNFVLAFVNSTSIAIAVTAIQVITSALAGYALARLKFRGKETLLLIILATLAIPFQILVIPIFLVLKWSHAINTYWSLILPTAANGFGIFLMRQYFASLPVELEEAATLDGANRWQILWRIMLPLSRPALLTLFLFTFIGEWNDLFKPLVFTTRPELKTVQLALAGFQEEFTNNWPLLMAAVIITTIPVIIIFLIGQRQFMQGIGTTGIKN